MTAVGATIPLAELDMDPYPTYDRLRRSQPVCWLPELKQWLVTGWTEVAQVLRDPESFTTDMPDSPMIKLCGGVPMLLREGADHEDVREAFIHDYDPHRVNDYVDTIVRPHAQRLLDALLPGGGADLLADYFEPVAALSEATLLGLGSAGADTLRDWGNNLARAAVNFSHDPDVDATAVVALADDGAVRAMLADLREHPDRSALSNLMHANRPANDGRADSDVLAMLKHIAMSVIEPGWLAGWTWLALLDHPDQLAQVRADRWLVGAAVYEALRWSGPVGALTRRTTRPVTLAGQDIPADALLAVSIASANRDHTAFHEPDRFDIHRQVRRHLGFGVGLHHCPAFAFVPAIARTAVDVLFDRIPDIQPAPGWRPAPHGWKLRLPGPIRMTWQSR
ncbi:MAG TPA: cytochrome P450 [Pseudonocardiaceae bacterium]